MKGTIEIHEPEAPAVIPTSPWPAPSFLRNNLEIRLAAPQRVLFSDSLLEFGTYRRRKAFATLASFLFNVLAIAGLPVLPFCFKQELIVVPD